jgi:hypothetical protein
MLQDAQKKRTPGFGNDMQAADENEPVNIQATSAYTGLSSFYAYNNIEDNKEEEKVSCGQGAIASMFDYYNVSPYKTLNRVATPHPAVDGKPHYTNELVKLIFKDYPPTGMFGVPFTPREVIMKALKDRQIHCDEAYAGMFGNGEEEKEDMKKWILERKRPVITLVDLHDMSKVYAGMGPYKDWYALHWAIVYGFTDEHAQVASWNKVFSVPWEAFMAGWHCKGLPNPNNYYAIYTYK